MVAVRALRDHGSSSRERPHRVVLPVSLGAGGQQVAGHARWSTLPVLPLVGSEAVAEGEGFEPPLPVRAKRFSRPPVSTTHTSLRVGRLCGAATFSKEYQQCRLGGFMPARAGAAFQ